MPVSIVDIHALDIREERGETFVQPQIIPPVHGHHIAKPLEI